MAREHHSVTGHVPSTQIKPKQKTRADRDCVALCTFEQAAKKLGITPEAVRRAEDRAVKKLEKGILRILFK